MDRIWGGFMEGIKEDADENGGGKGKEVLGTIEEEGMTPDTKAKRALNDKKNRRRRRRPKKNINDSIHSILNFRKYFQFEQIIL